MKFENFVLDSSTNVYVSKAELTQIRYFDGAEAYLKEALQSVNDLGLLSTEIKSKIKDWPSLYHLSPYRATIIDCFDFQNKEATVLELGAGCGGVTRWLGEHFQDVYAVEGSFQRACVTRLRCRDLSSVKVYSANFFDLDLEKQFDVVTLIGVLEYSHLYHPAHKRNPYEAALSALKSAHSAIKEHGILLLAIENKLGLKYFSGAKEDHSSKLFEGIQGYPDRNKPVTFSATELDNLLRAAGFTSVDFYLPFPDYKLAKTILNAQEPSSHYYLYNWIETPFPDRVTGQRILLFNESLALREISKADLLKDLSNSFLIIAHKGEKDTNCKNLGFSNNAWIVRHYSLGRYRTFCKRVSLVRTASGSLQVDNSQAFNITSIESFPDSLFNHTLTSEKYYLGNLLIFSAFEMIASGKFDTEFQSLLEKLNRFLLDHFSTGQKDETGIPLLHGESLDVALWNIIIEEKTGGWVIVDREWTFNNFIPVDFILWRNLYHFFLRYGVYLGQRYSSKPIDELTYEFLQKIYPSCNKDRCALATQFDQSFQVFVGHGITDVKTLPALLKSYQKSDTLEGVAQRIEPQARTLVSIVIPTLNNLDLTRQCLETIRKTTGIVSYEIIVVDNASTDGTPEYLRQEQSEGRLRTILNEENLGFGKASNQGARAAAGKYIVFLNNDTIPQPNWLGEMVRLAESDENIGIVGSKLLFPDGTIQHAGVVVSVNKLPYHIYRGCSGDLPAANKQRDYQIVTAACMLINKELFFEVGGFDERYINGCEDIDLCLKVGQKNKRVVYNPKSVLIHFEGKSMGRADRMKFNRQLLLSIWKDKIKQDEMYFLKQDNMELIVVGSSFKFVPRPQDNMELAVEPDGSFSYVTRAEKPKASIIIVTYNSAPTIFVCLDSVLQCTTGAEVIVVDNASADDTRNILALYKDRIVTILNDDNKGFSYACNQGIRVSKGEHIILLNPDTTVTPKWADRMIAHFKPDVGAVGAISNYAAALQHVGLYMKEKLSNEIGLNELAQKLYEWNCGQGKETKLLIGFCTAFPRKVLDEVGLLDEDLFLGNEDLEISWRLALKGYKLIVATDTFIYHKGQISFQSIETEKANRLKRESTEQLFAKLDAYYGVGNVPTPIDLWGVNVEFFGDLGASFWSTKPTFAAVYIVYNETTWLETSLESIYPECDAIYFLVSEKPWYGEPTDNRKTLESIKNFPDPEGKIQIVHGTWEIEVDKRNEGLDILQKAGFTYCFIIDTDEVYDPVELKRIKAFLASHPEIDCWHIDLDTYWKSYRYRIEPREPVKPAAFVKVGAARFTHIRQIEADNHGLIPQEIGIMHHLSYARSDEEIFKKTTSGSHAHEVQPGWFDNVWKKWDSDHSLTNLHPTHPSAYQRAVEQPYSALPPVLKRRYQTEAQEVRLVKGQTSIIILTHNLWDQTELCLNSIARHTPEPHEIIVVDNGSSDETLARLRELLKIQPDIHVIANATNRGFAAGNNQGIALAHGEYVLLLNNDTVVTEGWLDRMLDVFKRYPKTGIVGPMSNYVGGSQLVTDVDYKNLEELNNFAARWTKEHTGQNFLTYRVVGFCLLTRREVIDTIGGLDEQFGSGNFEDDDFCIRAALSGYEARVAQDVFIHHTGSQTFRDAGIDYRQSLLRNEELFKAKWGIPTVSPNGEDHTLSLSKPPGVSLYVPLPNVSSDHRVDAENRWWDDISEKEYQKKERVKGFVSIIILTSNQQEYLKKCVKSIKKHTQEPHEIIFVPSDSSHAPFKLLRKFVKENPNYKLIENKGGLGYAKTCNRGITNSSGEYIVIVTDDVLVTDSWLSGMLECLKSASDIGIVGPMAINVDGPQGVMKADYSSPDYLDQFAKAFREKNRYRRVTIRNLNGFCMLFRYELAEKIGLFDERFDSYEFANNDYCLRTALQGYRNIIAADVFVHHYRMRSLTGNRRDDTSVIAKNRRLYVDKWGGIDDKSPLGKKILNLNILTVANELNQKGQKAKAVDVLRKGIKDFPDDKRIYYTLADILIENEKFSDALEMLETMPEGLRQDFRRLELIGYCKEGMEVYEEADKYADEALVLNGSSPEAWNLKGTIAFKKGLHTDAEKFFTKALESDKGFGKAYTNLGALRWFTDDKEEAFRFFEKAFILAPTIKDIFINYHTASVSLSRLAKAEEVFKDAIILNPYHIRLKYLLVSILSQQGKYDEAMKVMEKAMVEFGTDDNTLSAALELRNKIGATEVDKTSKNTISLCMIVKNEQSKIGTCLLKNKSAVDEMIVVDTGSIDRTKDIAKALGAKVYDFEWTGNFADARNFSISKASGKWILILDADEVISSSDHDALKETIRKTGHKPLAYSIVTRNYVKSAYAGWVANDGSYITEEAGTGWFPGEKVRLFPNDKRIQFENPVHEKVEPSLAKLGIQIRKCSIPVHHYGELDRTKVASKGEEYYKLAKIRLNEKGGQDTRTLYELALQATELRRYDEALEYWEKLIAIEPTSSKAFYGMGETYLLIDRYEDALSSLKRAMQLDPDSELITKDTMLNYPNCEICAGDIETAISHLEGLLRKDPTYPFTMASLAVAYFCAGRKEKGMGYVKKLTDMNFSCTDYFTDFAKKLISAQKIDYAISLLESAVESKNENNDTSTLLAECYKTRK